MPIPRLCALILALAPAALLVGQDRTAGPAPVRITAEVDATALSKTGRALLTLQFLCDEPLEQPLAVRVELRRMGRLVLRRDHSPSTPTREWQKGQTIRYQLPLVFAQPPAGVRTGDPLEVHVGLLDPASGKTVAARAPIAGRDGLALVAEFLFAEPVAPADSAAVEAWIATARTLAEKQPRAAWDQLEFAFRQLDDYRLKAMLQQALLAVGKAAPQPMSFEEQGIVAGRIRSERARYLRQVAGRMFDRGRLLGALMLLDEVGGALQVDADRAVLGALRDAERLSQDRDAITERVFALTKDQQDEVQRLATSHQAGPARLAAAVKLARNPAHRPVARGLLLTLELTRELREAAQEARAEIEKAWLSDVPAIERAEAVEALQHPSFQRTTTRASHNFVLIGPEQLLAGIPADSLLRFDLAYLYLTDLFGNIPNPDGDRITVYWKELWEFGGGVGGGKIIDIGNADPQAKALRVDTGLLYHELTHCIDDTTPIYPGFREGLADFGAAVAQHLLGQVAAARAAMGLATRSFLQDYLDRDLEYWRIPNYGPSAGFLLHFLTHHGKDQDGFRFELYRRFFRDYRQCQVKDARTPNIGRAFAYHLVAAFGPGAFADLQRFRWPLVESDLEAVRREQLAARRTGLGPTFEDLEGSPVPRDRLARELHDRGAPVDAFATGLGVVRDWWVIGPFKRAGVDPDNYRFPPEHEIDLEARYESINNNPTWRRPGPRPVTVGATGWLNFEFAYQDDSAIYALTHVRVEQQTEAFFHLRADDDLTLFVNDEAVGKFDFAHGPVGPWRPGRLVLLPDAISFPVTLAKGRNKVLLKVRNGRGASGCVLAITTRNGMPLPGHCTDAEPPAQKRVALPEPDSRRWPSRFRLRFDTAGVQRRLDIKVGSFRVRNRALEGIADDRQVEWRKYTVRPGFPKDSPSNLAWLPEQATEHLDMFHLKIDLAAGTAPPKLCVILQGDGQRDALSGWTLILDPHRGAVQGHLERYDRRIYMSDPVPFDTGSKAPVPLELIYHQRRLTVRLGTHVLFDQAPIRPIEGRHRIGIATWGEALKIAEIELRGPTRTR